MLKDLNVTIETGASFINSNAHFDHTLTRFEIMGVLVLTIFFLVGFPANLLLIIHFIFEKMKLSRTSFVMKLRKKDSQSNIFETLPLNKFNSKRSVITEKESHSDIGSIADSKVLHNILLDFS